MTIWGTPVFIVINTCFLQIQSNRIYIAFSNGLSSVDPCDYFGTDCYITGLTFPMDCNDLVGLSADSFPYRVAGDNVDDSGFTLTITSVEM